METLYAAPFNTEKLVALAGTTKTRLVRKQIFRHGQQFVHPLEPTTVVTVTPDFEDALLRNFAAKTTQHVAFPLVDDQNRHVEAPERNYGEVVGLEKTSVGLDAIIEVRKDPDMVGSTLVGASALYHPNYPDTSKPNTYCGPTLLHVAGTNRPYLRDLTGFADVSDTVSLSGRGLRGADTSGEVTAVVALSAAPGTVATLEEHPMTRDELIAALAALPEGERVDVNALLAGAEGVALSGPKATEVATALGLSGVTGELGITDIADAVVELSGQVATITAERDKAAADLTAERTAQATKVVKQLIGLGKIKPAQEAFMVGLSMSDPANFALLVPDAPVVPLSGPVGVDVHEDTTDENEVETKRAASAAKAAAAITAGQPKGRRRGAAVNA